MIQIDALRIQEVRGIRDLVLRMNRKNFVVAGPNGSGKSGVVDAIEFALTGEIRRLTGSGTGDLSLADHGPHVEKRGNPAACSVRLDVFIPSLSKTASITRTLENPKHPTILPDDPGVRAVFADIAQHEEITLSRREIIKFILTESAQRSRLVQALLKLDAIDQVRATLKTTENKLLAEHATAKAQVDIAADSLRRHLDLPTLDPEAVLDVINKRREILGLSSLITLDVRTSFSEGLATRRNERKVDESRESALNDVSALIGAVGRPVDAFTHQAVGSIQEILSSVDAEGGLVPSIKRHSLVQSGLQLVDDDSCPLCDLEWPIDRLRAHLQDKLRKSLEANRIANQLLDAGRVVATATSLLRSLVDPVAKLPESTPELIDQLSAWSNDLKGFSDALAAVEPMIGQSERFRSGWAAIPPNLLAALNELLAKVETRPAPSATGAARDFLVVAWERWTQLDRAQGVLDVTRANAARGRFAYKAYCDVAEAELSTLYDEVEDEFGAYYRVINEDDEGDFTAKLESTAGKLDLLVDFHKKGMFPPSAYHSEGHQDGMGVCLYLALTKRTLGDKFTLAVLDDVVMSVDSQHRRQFCKLLKTRFAGTQFIITTHDQVWARQIRSEGLVGAKASVAFHTWRVETGPVLDEVAEVWDQIDGDLLKNDVPAAAARMRRHLEYVSADLADELGAKPRFKGDGAYDMGDLLSAVIGRQGELLNDAAKAARSWKDEDAMAKVEALLVRRNEILNASNGEQWVINKAIHYTEWANLSKNDFRPVVTAFKELLGQFRCSNPICDSWLSITPKSSPVDLRCSCGQVRLNLKEK